MSFVRGMGCNHRDCRGGRRGLFAQLTLLLPHLVVVILDRPPSIIIVPRSDQADLRPCLSYPSSRSSPVIRKSVIDLPKERKKGRERSLNLCPSESVDDDFPIQSEDPPPPTFLPPPTGVVKRRGRGKRYMGGKGKGKGKERSLESTFVRCVVGWEKRIRGL